MDTSLSSWRLIVDPPGDPAANMERDEQLAKEVRDQDAPPFLRIYRWSEPCVSIGSRQQPDDLPADWLKDSLPIVRRLTGGGAVFHRPDELTYSLGVPRVIPALPFPGGQAPAGRRLNRLPAFLHERLRDELVNGGYVPSEKLSILCANSKSPVTRCFDSPVCGDLLYQGRKVAGSALRVWKNGLLIQGTIQGLPVKQEALVQAFKGTFLACPGMRTSRRAGETSLF